MKRSGLKQKLSCLLAGKRVKIIGLILVLQIVFIGLPLRMAYPWGAFIGFSEHFYTADTHQQILKAAYDLLRLDPAMRKANMMYFGNGTPVGIDNILQYEGVASYYGISITGPGPDADGATPYSWHWYNPETSDGGTPKAASSQYYEFVMATLMPSFDMERAVRGMTWSAHFLADMFVPFHVNGVPGDYTLTMMERGSFFLSLSESGPLYLFNKTPSTALPNESLTDRMFQVGYGLDSDFSSAFKNYHLARLGAGSMLDPKNPVDWFDPWYWNGNLSSDVFSSHATYEANAHAAWIASGGYFTGVNPEPPYDPLWKNGRPDYEFAGNSGIIKSELVMDYTREAAIRTRDNVEMLFLAPVEAIKYAVEAVYTMWRSAWSALEPTVIAYPDPERPGFLLIKSNINNYALEPCRSVAVRLTVMQEGNVLVQRTDTLAGGISPNQPAEISWTYQTDLSKPMGIDVEVVGSYKITPDLQYVRGYYLYQSVYQPPSQQQSVFGDDKWSEGKFTGYIFYLPEGTSQLPDFTKTPDAGPIFADMLNIPERAFESGFPNVTSRFEWFALRYTGDIRIAVDQAGTYTFKLTSDDGSRLIIDNQIVINNDKVHKSVPVEGSILLTPGIHKMTVEYFQGPRFYVALILEVQPPGATGFRIFKKGEYMVQY